MISSPRFLGLDTVMIDFVVKVAALPERGMDELATDRLVTAGGGFNAMSAAARQGMAVTYLGQLGHGPFATLARTTLEQEGIEIPVGPSEDVDLGICFVFVDDGGERTFVTSPGAEGRIRASELDTVEIRESDVLFMSGYDFVYGELCEQVLTWLRTIPATLSVAFDPGPRVGDIETTVPIGCCVTSAKREFSRTSLTKSSRLSCFSLALGVVVSSCDEARKVVSR